MSSPKTTAIIACLLVGAALVFVGAKKPESAPTPKPIPTRDSLTRTKLPPRGVTASQLIASNNSARDRKSWARGLSDEELKKLAKEMIRDHQQGSGDGEATPWICTLAMEWGRRDFEGLMGELENLVPFVEISGIPNAKVPSSFYYALRTAAIVGLAEDDAAEAWLQFTSSGASSSSPTNSDFILPVEAFGSTNSALAAEVIARSWAEQDPEAAWSGISSQQNPSMQTSSAIRGLLAITNDPDLRQQILDWVAEKSRSAETQQTLNHNEQEKGLGGANIIGKGQRAGDGEITRNSINSILNNPNRTMDPADLRVDAAIGLAEQDMGTAWNLLRPADRVPEIGDIPLIGRLFDSTQSKSSDFLEQIASRDPNLLNQFLGDHSNDLNDGHRIAIATGLVRHDPIEALDVLAGIDDPEFRLIGFNNWAESPKWRNPDDTWPLIENQPTRISYEASIQKIEDNISRLGLDQASEEAARKTVDNLKARIELLKDVDKAWEQ